MCQYALWSKVAVTVAPVCRHKGHGPQLGRLALGRLAAPIILGRRGDVRVSGQVGAGGEQDGNPGASRFIRAEGGEDAGGPKQAAFVNQRHVTEETLNEEIVTVIIQDPFPLLFSTDPT